MNIYLCICYKEIWERLEITHEGTNEVKESKINMLVHKYELFKMELNESIIGMFTRFTDIVNNLKSLCKSYSNSDLIRKVLRSLPREWEAKVTTIKEAKDLTFLPLEELLGSLMTHELTLIQHKEESIKRTKSIALKAEYYSESDESGEEEKEDLDTALLVRRFRRFMKKEKSFIKKRN